MRLSLDVMRERMPVYRPRLPRARARARTRTRNAPALRDANLTIYYQAAFKFRIILFVNSLYIVKKTLVPIL